jgi:hypothetical protein
MLEDDFPEITDSNENTTLGKVKFYKTEIANCGSYTRYIKKSNNIKKKIKVKKI